MITDEVRSTKGKVWLVRRGRPGLAGAAPPLPALADLSVIRELNKWVMINFFPNLKQNDRDVSRGEETVGFAISFVLDPPD